MRVKMITPIGLVPRAASARRARCGIRAPLRLPAGVLGIREGIGDMDDSGFQRGTSDQRSHGRADQLRLHGIFVARVERPVAPIETR